MEEKQVCLGFQMLTSKRLRGMKKHANKQNGGLGVSLWRAWLVSVYGRWARSHSTDAVHLDAGLNWNLFAVKS